MSDYYNSNYSVIDTNPDTNTANNNTNTNTKKVVTKKAKPEIYEDFLIFGNFFGLVPDAYVKYFNLFLLVFIIYCYLILTEIFLYNPDFLKNNF